MASTIKLKTSTSSGNVPASLSKGEVAINVADGVWYYGGASAVQQNFTFGSTQVTGNTRLDGNLIVTGNTTVDGTLSAVTSITTSGNLDIDGTTNLDEVDVDGDITMANNKQLFLGSAVASDPAITFLADTDTGIRLHTAGSMRMVVAGADQVAFSDGALFPVVDSDVNLGHTSYYFKTLYIDDINASATVDINGQLVVDGTNISLDSTSTLNIDNSNTTNGITIGTATSGVPIQLGHSTSKVRVNDDLIVTGNTTVDGVMSATTRIMTGNIQAAANTITTGSGDLTIHPATARTLYFGNGEDGGAYDVVFYGAESNGMLWDQDIFTLNITGNLTVSNNIDFNGGANIDGTTISLDATSTLNIDNSNTSNGIKIGTVTSGVPIQLGHSTSKVRVNDDLIVTGNTVMDGTLSAVTSITTSGNLDVDGTTNLDNTDIDGTFAVDGTTISLDATTSLNIDNSNTSNGITIGTATSGVPIQLGHSTSKVRINDDLIVTGNTVIDGTLSAVTSITTSGNLDIDGTTNLDAVDIDGNVQLDGTLSVGVDDTGYDVKFFGATASRYMLWDESDDSLLLTDNTKLKVGNAGDLEIYHDSNNSYIDDTGTGTIFYRSGTQTFQNAAGSKTMATFNAASTVDLAFNNNVKLSTNTSGVHITGTLSASTSVLAGNGDIENGLISAGTVNGSYQYVGFMSSVAGSYMTTNDWIIPSIGGGISNHTWNQNTNYLGSNNTVGSSSFTLVNGMAHIGIPIPFDGYVKGFFCTCRNNGGASNPRNAGLFVGTNNWGSSSMADVTLRAYAAGDDDGGSSNSKVYKIDGMLTTAYKVSKGDIVLPAMYSPDADNVATQCTWTVVFKT